METRRASCSTGRQAPDQAPAPEIVSPFKPGQVPGFFFSMYRKFRATWPPGTWFPEWPPAWWSCAPGGAGNPSTGLVGLNLAAGRGRLTLNHCARYQVRAPGAGAWPTWSELRGPRAWPPGAQLFDQVLQLLQLQLFPPGAVIRAAVIRPGAVITGAGLADQVQLIATRCDLVELRGPGRPGASAGARSAGRTWWSWCVSWCRCLYVDTNMAPGVCMWMQTRCAAGRWAPAADQAPRATARAAWRVSGH